MPCLTMLVGPPGSGKSTFAKTAFSTLEFQPIYINQDSQGKFQHMENFREALRNGQNVLCDRMNFNKAQRNGYLEQAKKLGYYTVIHVLHQPYAVCMERMLKRQDHETIKDAESATKALNFFFKNYERVEDWEADEVRRHWPEGDKPSAVICDLDGTLCNIEHRRHWVRGDGKKNWPMFMAGIPQDTMHKWCYDILDNMCGKHKIVFCSGRGEEQRGATSDWLRNHIIWWFSDLFMRLAGDSRQDAIVKEIILDFEILSRYTPYFFIDDRKQVYQMWRKRGFVCLACDEGDF